jgi:translation initiation factor 2 alpha subunit (eIF-2alpha)
MEDKRRNSKMLTEIPFSLETGICTPELSEREKIRLLVNRIAAATSTPQHDIWNNIYQTLYYNYGISIKSYKKEKKNESLLDVAERKGFLDKMFAIASKLISDKIVA